MANTDNKVLPPSLGSDVKVAVTADIGSGLHLSDVDFCCTIYVEDNERLCKKYQKSELTFIDEDTYMALVKTGEIGKGQYFAKLEIDVPDEDVDGGIRKEVVRVPAKGVDVVS